MHKLKSDIIHSLQGENLSVDKLVEIADICDNYVEREENLPVLDCDECDSLGKKFGRCGPGTGVRC